MINTNFFRYIFECYGVRFLSACIEGLMTTSYKLYCHIAYIRFLKLHCDTRFQRAFTACNFIFEEITLVWANQCNYFENTSACGKRTLKTTVATQLKQRFCVEGNFYRQALLWSINDVILERYKRQLLN